MSLSTLRPETPPDQVIMTSFDSINTSLGDAFYDEEAGTDHLSRDQRLQVITLRDATDWTFEQIANWLGCSMSQAHYAYQAGHPSPSKHTGKFSLCIEI